MAHFKRHHPSTWMPVSQHSSCSSCCGSATRQHMIASGCCQHAPHVESFKGCHERQLPSRSKGSKEPCSKAVRGSDRQQHLRLWAGDEPVHKGPVITPTGKELLMEGVPSSTGHIPVVAPVCGYLLLRAHVCYLQPDQCPESC